MPGRKPFTPTEEQRRTVRAMAGFGVPQDDIALVLRTTSRTMRKWFRDELDVAAVEANARVAQCLFQQATTPGSIAATIFWLKARAGWREKQQVEVTGPNSTPLSAPVSYTIITGVTRDQAEAITPSPLHMIEGRSE